MTTFIRSTHSASTFREILSIKQCAFYCSENNGFSSGYLIEFHVDRLLPNKYGNACPILADTPQVTKRNVVCTQYN